MASSSWARRRTCGSSRSPLLRNRALCSPDRSGSRGRARRSRNCSHRRHPVVPSRSSSPRSSRGRRSSRDNDRSRSPSRRALRRRARCCSRCRPRDSRSRKRRRLGSPPHTPLADTRTPCRSSRSSGRRHWHSTLLRGSPGPRSRGRICHNRNRSRRLIRSARDRT
jgi:hypothetical protein